MGLSVGLVKEAPLLGDSGSDESQVNAFYGYWLCFSSVMDFVWVDKWDSSCGVNRKSRRVMEEENAKLRRKAKKEFHETVRGLAAFVKKRDPRVLEMRRRKEAERERKCEEERERRKEREREKAERAREYKEEEWTKGEEIEEEVLEEDEEEDEEEARKELYCVACGKKFKSEKQWKNHEKSKKHKEKVERLRKEFLEEEDEDEEETEDAGENGFVSANEDDIDDLDDKWKECFGLGEEKSLEKDEEHEEEEEEVDANGQEQNGVEPSSDSEMVNLEAMISGRRNKRRGTTNYVEKNNALREEEGETMEYNNKKEKRKSRRAKKDKGKGVPQGGDAGTKDPVEQNNGINAAEYGENGDEERADDGGEASTSTKTGKQALGRNDSSKQDAETKSKNSTKGRKQKVSKEISGI